MKKELNKDAATLAKAITLLAFRNAPIENIHAGKFPTSLEGNFSDVYIVDAAGNKIPWNDASRISQEEMKTMMKHAVNKVYELLTQMGDPEYHKKIDYAREATYMWDDPEI